MIFLEVDGDKKFKTLSFSYQISPCIFFESIGVFTLYSDAWQVLLVFIFESSRVGLEYQRETSSHSTIACGCG